MNKHFKARWFNVLLVGEPDRAADTLGDMAGKECSDMEVILRIALINALRRIATLEGIARGSHKP